MWAGGDYMPSSGTIEGGQLSYTIGLPNTFYTTAGFSIYGNIRANPIETQTGKIEGIMVTPSNRGIVLGSDNTTVSYWYVDRDATMSGVGSSQMEDGTMWTMAPYTMNFKKGWNALTMIYTRVSATTVTITCVLGADPNAVWTFR